MECSEADCERPAAVELHIPWVENRLVCAPTPACWGVRTASWPTRIPNKGTRCSRKSNPLRCEHRMGNRSVRGRSLDERRTRSGMRVVRDRLLVRLVVPIDSGEADPLELHHLVGIEVADPGSAWPRTSPSIVRMRTGTRSSAGTQWITSTSPSRTTSMSSPVYWRTSRVNWKQPNPLSQMRSSRSGRSSGSSITESPTGISRTPRSSWLG